MSKPSGKPRCPNHGCELEGLPFPLTEKGTGRCPVSLCTFEYQIKLDKSETEMTVDKFGNKIKKMSWEVNGDEPKPKNKL